jgi:predicted MFS family arabinose efflux permease
MASRPVSPLRSVTAGMIALAAAMGIGRFVYTPLLPGMMETLDLSAADAGLIASANYLGYLGGAMLAAGGWAEGRERPLMLGALAASTLLVAAMGLTESLPLFLAIRLLAGVASAFAMLFATSIVFLQLAKAGRGDLQALHFSGVGLGIVLTSMMMLAPVEIATSWRTGWFLAAALSGAALLAVAWLVDRGPPRSGPTRPEPGLPRSRQLAGLILAYGLFGLGYVVTATFLVALVREAGEGARFEAFVWLATGVAAVPSIVVWNRIAARAGLRAAFVAACVVEAAGVAASVMLGGIAGPLAGGVLLGGTFVAITALGLQLGRLLAPLAPRRVFALMTAAFGLGQIVGPVAAGLASQWSGSFLLPSLGAAAALLASAIIAWTAGISPDSR